MSDVLLAELKESAATGHIADIYQDLRLSLRVPMVNLIFRHLATVPGCLEWTWASVGQLYVSGALNTAASALNTAHHAPRLSLPSNACGLDHQARQAVILTCDAYARANPANLLALRVLELILDEPDGEPDGEHGAVLRAVIPRPAPIALDPLPPMGDLALLPPDVTAVLRKLAIQVHGEDGPVIPSFYRHFTAQPAFLAALHEHLGAIMPLLNAMVGDFENAARLTAQDLYSRVAGASRRPKPSPESVAALRAIIARFPPNLCKMTLLPQAISKAVALT